MPVTIVTLVDDDGDEFPIALPGVYRQSRDLDVESALKIAQESVTSGVYRPNGTLRFGSIDYRGEIA